MTVYLEVAVNVPQVTGVFHYHLPPELEALSEGIPIVGRLVKAPFGRQIVHGVVLDVVQTPTVPETRAVIDFVDPEVALTPVQIELARRLSKTCLAPLSACLDLMLPPGLAQQADTLYTLESIGESGKAVRKVEQAHLQLSETQERLIALLRRRGPLRGQQIDRSMPRVNWRPAARTLVEKGILSSRAVLPPPRVKPKTTRTAQLICSAEMAEQAMGALGRAGTPSLARRQSALRFLLNEPGPIELAWIMAETGCNAADLRHLADIGLVRLGEGESLRNPLVQACIEPTSPPELTPAQLEVWSEIQQMIHRSAEGEIPPPILLHGVTGSGKTEIYLHAVQEVQNLGKQAIVLVPEISLTPQTVQRFASRFPGGVGVMHSGLTAGERYDTWRRARAGALAMVIGARSGLFAPFPRLGIIILDECHDDSYYQEDPVPRYDARSAAIAYARLAGAVCLLGSATPNITSTYAASRGEWRYLSLPQRILAHQQIDADRTSQVGAAAAQHSDLPVVQVVDMRQELKENNRSIFSRPLQVALEEVLSRNQQAILFLNRRGTATYVFCRQCGRSLKCPRCDTPLTFHSSQSVLICHYCRYQRNMPRLCPACKSDQIRHYGVGTEQVEALLGTLFPQARLLRWDYDTTRHKGAHELILNHFAAHRADILIGTQMLAKGLDLPLVTLVGVILAEVGLNLPDYRASERTFQLLTQVAGRAGRSPLGGQVILQTFQPEHYVIQAASRHDYRSFYHAELDHRKRLAYPPFVQLARLEIRHRQASQAQSAAEQMAGKIKTWLEEEDRHASSLVGPVPCFFSQRAGEYRWQIILRGPDPAAFLQGKPLGEWRVEINPSSLL